MKIIYSPDDGDEQRWDFDPQRLMVAELEAVEHYTGMSLLEFAEGLGKGRVAAYRAVVWVMRKRHGEPSLRYQDVDFPIGALSFDSDDEEVPKEDPPPSGDAGG